MPSTRRSDSACDDTSIAQAPQPRSTISRSSACTSGASGVVRVASRTSSPIAIGDGAEHAAADAGGLEDRRDQIGRRRLAVGAGDADDLHLAARMAIERRGEQASASRASDDHRPRHVRRRAGAGCSERPRPRRARSPGARTRAPSACCPFSATNTLSRLDRARVVGDAGDRADRRLGAQRIVGAESARVRAARRAVRPRSWLARARRCVATATVRATRRQTRVGLERRARRRHPATTTKPSPDMRAVMPSFTSLRTASRALMPAQIGHRAGRSVGDQADDRRGVARRRLVASVGDSSRARRAPAAAG